MRIFRKTLPSTITKKAVELVAPYAAGIDERAYIFCDSKSTLSYESAVAERFGGSFSVEVTSFSRYVVKRRGAFDYLNKSSSALVIADILAKRKNDLTRLASSDYSTAMSVYELIEQFKAAKISPDDLKEIVETERTALAFKLKDIRLIYSDYEEYLKANYLSDDGTVLSLMPELLRADESIKGKKVVVAGISNFTKQSIDIVIALERLCDLDCVLLSYDGDSAVNESYYKFLEVFPDAEVFDDDEVYPRAAEILKDRLFAPERYSDKGEYTDKVKVVEAADALEEAEFVAKTIRAAVSEEKRRFKDFAVACPDVDLLAPIFKKAFSDYDIPIYADLKMPLSSHPKVALFSALVELKRKNCRTDCAVALSKNALAFDKEDSVIFEEYVLKNAVARYAMRSEFSAEAAEKVRQIIVRCNDKLVDNGLIDRHIAAIKSVFDELEVESKLEKLEDELRGSGEDVLADFSRMGSEAFDNILSQTERLFSGVKLKITDLNDLVLSAAAACEISLLPRRNDCVFLGDYRSTRIRNSSVLFCTGLTDDTPFCKSDDALLCDRELIRMEKYRLVVEPKISIVNKREKENVATTLMSFNDRLYATYSLLSASGEKTRRGPVVDYILRAFSDGERTPFLSIESEKIFRTKDDADNYLTKGAGIKNYFKAIENFRNKNTDDLTAASSFLKAIKDEDGTLYSLATAVEPDGDKNEKLSYSGNLSSSLVENYFECPYSAFGKKILRLEESETGEIEAREFGTLIHAVLEEFAKVCDGLGESEVAAVAERIVDEVLERDEYFRYCEKKRYRFAISETKKEAIKECERVYRLQKRSDYKVFGTEIRFGDDKNAALPSIRIKTPSGERKISGYIDRMDVCRRDGKTFARVIDYKTGSSVDKKADLSKLYVGKNVQLYLYMNAVKNGGYLPAGLHYFAANDDYIENGKVRRTFYGAMLGGEDVLSGMDHDIAAVGKSADYGVAGEVNNKDVFDEKTFSGLIEYAKRVTESGAEEMAKGCFIASPSESACTYCKLKGACRFDDDDRTRERETISADGERILKAVEDDDEKNR